MRISEYYSLNRQQPTLDFVDVDIVGDVKVFVDPRALRLLPSQWGDECVSLVQHFFRTVLIAIRDGQDDLARRLLRVLREPNETHLGLSRGRARGRALGHQSARDVWEALSRSEAVRSGLLEDLEDTILMVEGIDVDIVSDVTTNIIRQPLIQYTQDACAIYSIPLVPSVDSGPLWDPGQMQWHSTLVPLPVAQGRKLLLVPKVIVRRRMDYDSDEYYREYLLEFLKDVELSANSELVQLLKNGRSRVTKKDLEAKYGRGKSMIVRETRLHPEVLDHYRADKRQRLMPPLSHDEIAEAEGTPPPDWDSLLDAMRAILTGREHADAYEKAIEKLLTTLFYPSLANPQVQHQIHHGRKRIDLTYTNVASSGFFRWLSSHYAAPHVFVECKNYTGDPGNPELDQLSGRFSPSRGQFGFLVCRSFENKDLFIERCRDTALDDRGFIIALDDDDVGVLVQARRVNDIAREFALLKSRFDQLIN
jgi:hypothetical protein